MTKSCKHCGKRKKLLVLSNFFFCNYVFKKPSAAETSESVYMRERVNHDGVYISKMQGIMRYFFRYTYPQYKQCFKLFNLAGMLVT